MNLFRRDRTASGAWLLLSLSLLIVCPSKGHGEIAKEYQVKAVFLYNFVQFVTWPPQAFSGPGAPFRIGILGEDPFGSYLDETVKGEMVDGHPLVVERYGSVAEAGGCQILFVGRSEMGNLESIFASIQGKPILTIGDAQGFIQRGGIVRFDLKDNKVHLRISLKAAKRARLEISSKLLRLADIVDTGGE